MHGCTFECGDEFFSAYTTALHNAFIDFAVETPELIQILSQTFEDSVEEYQSATHR